MNGWRCGLAGAGLLALGVVGCAPQPWPSAPAEGGAAPASGVQISPPDRVTVMPGDTLYGLAQRYHVPVRMVIDANHLAPPYRLAVGTILILPRTRTHLVRAGETLTGVARRYGVDVSTLAAANHLAPPYVIRRGEALALPAPVETLRRAPAPAAAASPPAASRPVAAPAPAAVARASLPPPPSPKPPERKTALAPPPGQHAEAPPSPLPTPVEPPADLPLGATGFIWPVHGRILASFGVGDNGTQNDGINLAAPAGTPVLAAAAGTVAYAGNELRGYGNLILIKHANGLMTAYAHNGAMLVKRGDRVRRGEPIAKVGATGAVSEPQLHFEIRRGTRALDPAAYLPTLSAAAGG